MRGPIFRRRWEGRTFFQILKYVFDAANLPTKQGYLLLLCENDLMQLLELMLQMHDCLLNSNQLLLKTRQIGHEATSWREFDRTPFECH